MKLAALLFHHHSSPITFRLLAGTRSQFVAMLSMLFCLHTAFAFSQEVKGWEVVPPSPDAAALGKYGNTPVSMYTGIPEITIPLHTIKTKRLELPVSLNYHASGFRVSEVAPWTGLGWTLSAGGALSRSTVGLGDDCGLGFLDASTNQSASEINGDDLDYVMSVSSGTADNESDLYFFNFAGRSGKFILDDNRKPLTIPISPLKITYNSVQNSFSIVTENGTIYTFASRETITAGVYTPLPPFFEDSQTYTGTYYLTEIVSADGSDNITFTYAADGMYTENNTNYSESIGDKCASVGINSYQHDYNSSTNFRRIDYLRLSEIVFANGRISFVKVADRIDGPSSRLSEIRIEKKNASGGYDLEKSILLETAYFSSGNSSRLKLKGVLERDAVLNVSKRYKFQYNESTLLPPRNSLAQDWWGYYNAKNASATSLVPIETISHLGQVYQVGQANRSPDANAMKACIISKIEYPTGGYTEFEFEPHYFGGSSLISKNINASSGAMGNTTQLLEQTVQFTPTKSGWARVSTHCSNVTDTAPFFSTVTVKTNSQYLLQHTYDPYSFPPFGPELTKDYWISVSAGLTYDVTVRSKGNSQSSYYNGAAFSKATVYWEEYDPNNPPVMAGGLRVTEIRDYASAGSSPNIKIYKYGENESGKGLLLTPQSKLGSFKEIRAVRYWKKPGSFCVIMCETSRQFIYANAPHDLVTFNGATVVYPQVTVYDGSTSSPVGRRVFQFNAEGVESYVAAQGFRDGVILLDNCWKSGDMVSSRDFVGSTSSSSVEKKNVHSIFLQTDNYSTKIGKKVVEAGECNPEYSAGMVSSTFYYFDYPTRSGIKKLTSTKEITHSTTNLLKTAETENKYFYDNLSYNHQQITRKIIIESDGSSRETSYWYPADYGSVGNLSSLISKHIINIPVKEEAHRNGEILSGSVSLLNADGKPYEIYAYESTAPQAPPVHSPSTLVPSGYVKKLDISYDGSTKNIQKVQPVNNAPTAYLWGYNNTYPVAMAVNASSGDIAATSFESDGKGNWTYSGTTYNDNPVKTGTRYYKLSGGSITRVISTGKYKLEYWAKGTVTITGGTITTIATSTADANGWIFYQKEVNAASSLTLTLSGTTSIDELRLYPVTAQMTTYSYDRLNGMTSANDSNNRVTYFEYDTFGRLKWTKDKDGNIVKAMEYHYQGN